MSGSTIEVTPKSAFGYALFFIGLLLLGYTAFQCYLLAGGISEPLVIEFEESIGISAQNRAFLGVILQIGMYGLLIGVSYILMKVGINIARNSK